MNYHMSILNLTLKRVDFVEICFKDIVKKEIII
jgi:hypothetical protein